jgi:hypothetical protein
LKKLENIAVIYLEVNDMMNFGKKNIGVVNME